MNVGNESAAVVELAVHQDIPKSFEADSVKNDRRVGTLTDSELFEPIIDVNTTLLGPEYKAFLEEFNNLILRRVTDFDELIREIEEKEKRLEKGMVCETPLVKFLVLQALEKVRPEWVRNNYSIFRRRNVLSACKSINRHYSPKLMQKMGTRTSEIVERVKVSYFTVDHPVSSIISILSDDKFKKPKEVKEDGKQIDGDGKKKLEKPKRTDNNGPKRADNAQKPDDIPRPPANETTSKKRGSGKKPKEPKNISEFGNAIPKLLTRDSKGTIGMSSNS